MMRTGINFLGGVLLLLPIVSSAQEAPVFDDIAGSEARAAVEFLQENDVVEGFADGTFRPEKTITRAEFLKIVLESKADVETECTAEKSFSDVPADVWFFPYVCSAVNQGIIEGYGDGTFRPHDNINYRDAAKITAKVHELTIDAVETSEWFVPFTTALDRERVVPGSVSDTGQLLTRGEMSQMVWGIATGNEVANETRGALPQIASCDELEAQLRKFERRTDSSISPSMPRADMMMEEAMDMDEGDADFAAGAVAPTTSSESKAADDFSGTNVQEAGVDEADVIKNDGSHIFLIKNDSIRIIKAFPADELAEVASISLADTNLIPREVFLDGDLLTVIATSYGGWGYYEDKPMPMMLEDDMAVTDMAMPSRGIMPEWGGQQKTSTIVYDISDRSAPEKIRSVSVEGDYLSSRRIGKTVYVATSRSNYIYGIPRPFEPEPFLPLIEDSAFPTETVAIDCADFRYVPNFSTSSTLVVTGVPTDDASEPAFREVVLGAGDNFYASPRNMFITRTVWDENYRETGPDAGWFTEEETEFYRFALEPDSVQFTGKAEAPGRVLNQFSMSESGDYFRIATQRGQAWGGQLSETLVTIFDKDLKQTGQIDGIAPGENMKSARFVGDRAFLVTFKTVDPLFVIDLDPNDPTILGKLKIPGWSDYLHPWDENHLIGFGKEVDESIDADKVHSDSAVYYTAVLGMKLAIFDISDLSDPKEIHKEIIGYRGTTSEVLTNHKALLVDTDKGILGFPITITENMNDEVGVDADIETVFAGARLYDVSLTDGFSLRGAVSHYEDDSIYKKSGEYFYGDPDLNIQRIIYIGDTFYSISQNVIKALEWSDLSEIGSLSLDKRSCDEIRTQNECTARSDCVAVFQTVEECRQQSGEEEICEGERKFVRCEAE